MKRLPNVLHATCALLLSTMAMTTVYAKELPTDFAQRVPLTLNGDGPWFSLNIPLDVQAITNKADLRDVRVFDAQGQPQAFALISDNAQQTTSTAREAEVRLFPLRRPVTAGAPQPDIRIEQSGTIVEVRTSGKSTTADASTQTPTKLRGWLLDASKLDFPMERLQLNWSSTDEGFQSFSIEGSDDLEHWSSWGNGQIARLAFDGERLDVSEVPLPGRRAKYLRLLWPADLAAIELKSARLLGSTRTTAPARLLWSTPTAGHPAEKDGEFRWNLPQAMPLQRARIVLPPELKTVVAPVDLAGRDTTVINQNRSVRPTSSAQRHEVFWSPLARGVIYRLPIDGRTSQVDELEIRNPQAVRELRLRVDSRGTGLGGQPPMLSYGMNGTRLVFLAQGQAPYQLAFGNTKVQAANLPLTVLIPGYNESSPPVLGTAELSTVTGLAATNTAVHEATAKVQAVDTKAAPNWKKMGLWGVLLIGVALLILMALSLLKKKPSA